MTAVGGSQPTSGHASAEKTGSQPHNRATLVSNTNIRELASSGWLSGTVINSTSDGIYTLSTRAGDISISTKTGLPTGASLLISYDDKSGKILFKLDTHAGGNDSKHPAPPETAKAQPNAANQSSRVQATIAASSVAPVVQSPPTDTAGISRQALSAIFPYTQSASFALAVALFPMTVRGGIIGKLMEAQEKRYAPMSRLAGLANSVNIERVLPVDGSNSYISWNMPFLSHGKIMSTLWQSGEQQSVEGSHRKLKRTFMQAEFPFSGLIQIEAIVDDKNISVVIASEFEIPTDLTTELREIIHVMARAFEMHSNVSYVWGPNVIEKAEEIRTGK